MLLTANRMCQENFLLSNQFLLDVTGRLLSNQLYAITIRNKVKNEVLHNWCNHQTNLANQSDTFKQEAYQARNLVEVALPSTLSRQRTYAP